MCLQISCARALFAEPEKILKCLSSLCPRGRLRSGAGVAAAFGRFPLLSAAVALAVGVASSTTASVVSFFMKNLPSWFALVVLHPNCCPAVLLPGFPLRVPGGG